MNAAQAAYLPGRGDLRPRAETVALLPWPSGPRTLGQQRARTRRQPSIIPRLLDDALAGTIETRWGVQAATGRVAAGHAAMDDRPPITASNRGA